MKPPEPFDPSNLIDAHEVLHILASRLPRLPTRQTVWNWMERGIKVAGDKRIFLQHITKLSVHYTTRKWLDIFLKEYEAQTHDIPTPVNRNRRKR
jgi:hypothetical protein